MHPVLKCCFLLLLWGCDWVGDPYCGTCPWSQSWGNQETVCPSVQYRGQLSRACVPFPPSPWLALVPTADQPPAPVRSRPGWGAAVLLRAPEFIYVFMALRR
jgi:hypothetical protein